MAEEAKFNTRLFEYLGGPKGEAAGYIMDREGANLIAYTDVAIRATAKLDQYARTEEGKALRGLLATASKEEFEATLRSDDVQAYYITEALDQGYNESLKAAQAKAKEPVFAKPLAIEAMPLIKETLTKSERTTGGTTEYGDPGQFYCSDLAPSGYTVNKKDGSISYNFTATLKSDGEFVAKEVTRAVSLVKDKDGKYTLYQSGDVHTKTDDPTFDNKKTSKSDPEATNKISIVKGLEGVSEDELKKQVADKTQRDRENEPVKVNAPSVEQAIENEAVRER